jgi:branched-chain amino acid transport system ATP-binding protein
VALLEVDDVSVRFGGIVALDSLSFTSDESEICGLIGPNGAGKTTLFNVISRVYRPTTGRITYAGTDLLSVPPHGIAGVGVARTFQNLALFPTMTVLENVMVGATSTSKVSWVEAALRIGARKEDDRLKADAMVILHELGLAEYALHPAAGLAYGTLKRIEIARAMAASPRLLLLDEPASGLTHAEVDELADTIRELRARHGLTVLLVEHHMQMVMGISDKVVVLNFGRKIAEGTPTEISSDAGVIEAYLGSAA